MLALPQPKRAAPAAAKPPLSFDALYRAHAELVGRWAQRLGGPEVEPDETIQEVFLTVNRRLASFRGESKVTSWLFQITAHTVANQRRALRRRRRRWVTLSSRIVDQAASRDPGPGEIVESRQAIERFYRVLDALSENHRNVIVLFELEEMSTEEIAALFERPPATVRVWLHRARTGFAKRWHAELKHEDSPRQDARDKENP